MGGVYRVLRRFCVSSSPRLTRFILHQPKFVSSFLDSVLRLNWVGSGGSSILAAHQVFDEMTSKKIYYLIPRFWWNSAMEVCSIYQLSIFGCKALLLTAKSDP